MKTKSPTQVLITILLIATSFHSCKKEDMLQATDDIQMKSAGHHNDAYSLYLPHEIFERNTGKPVNVIREIGKSGLNNFQRCLRLNVQNGVNGTNFVSDAIIKIDGVTVLRNSDFKNHSQMFRIKLCHLTEKSVMEVKISGKPGSRLDIWIEGKLANTGNFKDCRDDHIYSWIKIGDQVWMQENLAFLPSVSPFSEGSFTDPYYYVGGYQGTSVEEAKATGSYQTYGVLYNWPAAMNGSSGSVLNPSEVQGICPCGWHLPSDAEWNQLSSFLGGVDNAGAKMKESGTAHWLSPNLGATNESGFTALPAGLRDQAGNLRFLGDQGDFWASSDMSETIASLFGASYQTTSLGNAGNDKQVGTAVRCIKDK